MRLRCRGISRHKIVSSPLNQPNVLKISLSVPRFLSLWLVSIAMTFGSALAQITPTALENGTKGITYPTKNFTSQKVDPTDRTILWRVYGSVPPGMDFSRTGTYSGTPKQDGTYRMTFRAISRQNGNSIVKDSIILTHTIGTTSAPSIQGPFTLPSGQFDQRYQGSTGVRLTATGGMPYQGSQYRWELLTGTTFQTLPKGMTLSAQGVISGVPSERGPTSQNAQTYTFRVKVSDMVGNSDTSTFTLDLAPANTPLILTECPLPEVIEKEKYPTVRLEPSGGKPPYFWRVSPVTGLPPGLTLDYQTGVISGVPSLAGVYNFDIMLRDSNGWIVPKSCSITIRPAPEIFVRPIFKCARVGDSACEVMQAAGGDQPYTWSASGLPPGFTITQSSNSQAKICGRFTQPGTYTVNVTAVDKVGRTDTEAFTFTVKPALEITTASPLPFGILGYSYPGKTGSPTVAIQITGGRTPYSWSKIKGNLPPGLSLNPDTGVISGVPTLPGTYRFTVRVEDSCKEGIYYVEKEFQITIHYPISVTPDPITCLTVNRPVSFNVTANGISAPYSWSQVTSSSPSFSLSVSDPNNSQVATISGTPTQSGVVTFNFSVTSLGVTENFTINAVVSPELQITSDCPPGETTIGSQYLTSNLTASGGHGKYTWNATLTRQDGTAVSALPIVGGRVVWTPSGAPGDYKVVVDVRDECGNVDRQECDLTIYDSLSCNQSLQLPCLSLRADNQDNISLQIVADNDFALFAGNSAAISREIYQNPSEWNIQIENALSLEFSLETGEDTLYLLAMDGGGSAQISGKINRVNIADIDSNNIHQSPNIVSFLPNYPYDNREEGGVIQGGYSANLTDAQNALNLIDGDSWINPVVDDSSGVITLNPYAFSDIQNRNVGFSYLENSAVFYRFSVADIGLGNVLPDTIALTVTGGKSPYSWTITGRLPAGLQHKESENGDEVIFFGSITESGNFTFTATATDSLGNSCSRNHTIVVYPELQVSTTCPLPSGTAGAAYSAKLSASGGLAPYTWTIDPSELPPGLTLNAATGRIEGAPTTAGNYTFAYRVSDSCGQEVEGICSIEIKENTILSCLKEIWVVVDYPGCCGHTCNKAAFDIFANGVKIMVANLNNIGTSIDWADGGVRSTAAHSTFIFPYREVATNSYARWNEALIDGSLLTQIAEKSSDGKVIITASGNSTLNSCGGCSYHDPIGRLRVYTSQIQTGAWTGAWPPSNLDLVFDTNDPKINNGFDEFSSKIAVPVDVCKNKIVNSATSIQAFSLANLKFHNQSGLPNLADQISMVLVQVGTISLSLQHQPLLQIDSIKVANHEITNNQYTELLNAAAKSDPNQLYNPNMANVGIQRSSTNGVHFYTVDSELEHYPVTYVSWFDAARYANWLANGKPSGVQDSTTTEDGVYNLSAGASIRNAINPNTGLPPTYWLLNESEWYTSAYLNADGSAIWTYPTQSNTVPDSSGANPSNFANFGGVFGQSTPVGFFDQSPGPFGTFDQGGNVREWTETLDTSSGTPLRIIRGGSWADSADAMRADESFIADPTLEDDKTGFRIGGVADAVVAPVASAVIEPVAAAEVTPLAETSVASVVAFSANPSTPPAPQQAAVSSSGVDSATAKASKPKKKTKASKNKKKSAKKSKAKKSK